MILSAFSDGESSNVMKEKKKKSWYFWSKTAYMNVSMTDNARDKEPSAIVGENSNCTMLKKK